MNAASAPHAAGADGGAQSSSKPLRVLGVDDDAGVRETIRGLIDRTPGMKWIDGLSTAEDLVAHCKKSCPDIVLLDLIMPGPSIFDALLELREVCPESRAIILTSHESQYFMDKAFECGAWGFVSKFESNERLLDTIRAVAQGVIPAPRRSG